MIDKQTIINELQETIAKLQALPSDGSDVELGIVLTKAAASLAHTSAAAAPYISGGTNPNPSGDVLQPIKNIMGDLGAGEGYYNRISNFITAAGEVPDEASLISLVLNEVVDPNWSFQIDITGQGKKVSLINGSEIINLGQSLINGNPLDVQTAVLGIATKFEKEVFGFSVVETVKELDALSSALLARGPADFKMESVLNTLDGLIGKMGGPRLSPMLKSILSLVSDLNTKRLEAKKVLEDAVKEFEEKKEELLTGVPGTLPDEETSEEGGPSEEETTTTLPPNQEEPYLPPVSEIPEEEKPGEDADERELYDSALEFEDSLSPDDEDYF